MWFSRIAGITNINVLCRLAFGVLLAAMLLPTCAHAGPKWGLYTSSNRDAIGATKALESLLGNKFDNILYFSSIADDFNIDLANRVKGENKHLHVVLEFFDPALGANQPKYRLKTITNGDHDNDIIRWAKQVKSFNDTVYIMPMSEMNGNWLPWGGTVNGNSPGDYIPAWRHLHDKFSSVGAVNVKWIWAPNAGSVPNTAPNDPIRYYPGDKYVDYIGVNGYNFGPPGDSWKSFYDIFMPFYKKTKLITVTDKPIIIGEAGCAEGAGKAKWINDMFSDLSTSFPRVQQINWFNINKERDWRIESSQSSINAFKTRFVSSNAMPSTPPGTNNSANAVNNSHVNTALTSNAAKTKTLIDRVFIAAQKFKKYMTENWHL
jgi:hypothetical protein